MPSALPYAFTISRLGAKAFPKILLSNIVFVLALFAAKEALLSYDVGVFWVVMRVLALGALGMLVWEGTTMEFSKGTNIEVRRCLSHLLYHLRMPQWTALGVSSLLLFVQQAALYTALYRLPSARCVVPTTMTKELTPIYNSVILFVHFSSSWVDAMVISPYFTWKSTENLGTRHHVLSSWHPLSSSPFSLTSSCPTEFLPISSRVMPVSHSTA